MVAGIAMRRLRTTAAVEAIGRAEAAARPAGIASLAAEVEEAARALAAPPARMMADGESRLMRLGEVEALLSSGTLVVDACRRVVRLDGAIVPLASRPVLFTLARVLAEAWPGDVPRDVLLARAFRAKAADESHRARLRVEIGRLRATLRRLSGVAATAKGFRLEPRDGRRVALLVPPIEEEHAEVLALLADGEAWSSSALGIALGTSQRTVQRALDALAAGGRVQAFGRGPAQRWLAPTVPGFPTTLLLPAPLPGG